MDATTIDLTATRAALSRPRRAALVALVVGAAFFASSASAGAAPTWHAVDAGAPTTVKFLDIASANVGSPASTVVIAVGEDLSNPSVPAAVIYRLAGGTWYVDTISSLPAPDT